MCLIVNVVTLLRASEELILVKYLDLAKDFPDGSGLKMKSKQD